ncbi:NAD(P)-dependent alcohol dehydrogenase [Nocardioides gilvus]|uniref:NAD(P)-dependent alcohol dehydrogenase n=1 Tax=Nocardioides gilvus TaxID=1735589 RepID=UPI000D74BBEF|nr:NAD(P)-dependent alcohol dehydrogenase [Nocardioides gilvus]
MKAIVHHTFGSPEVLHLEDVPTPAPQTHEILLRNHATTVTSAETAGRQGKGFARLYFGPLRPRFEILGSAVAGEVVATGAAVERFAVGDLVVGGVGPRFGALAEFVCVAENAAITRLPDHVSWAEAAAVADGALTALPFLRDHADLQPGQHILVNGASGASGAVGSAAVQLAKHLGATVTAVSSGRNHDLVRSLGADDLIDYTREDFTRSGKTYDVVFDAVGKSSYARCKRLLTPTGRYLTTVPSLGILARTLLTSRSKRRRGSIAFTGLRPLAKVAEDLAYVISLVESGDYRPVIDRTYPLGETAEAHRYVDTERKRGSVVITIDPGPER